MTEHVAVRKPEGERDDVEVGQHRAQRAEPPDGESGRGDHRRADRGGRDRV